ncbi:MULTISPECIES: acyl-CoA dehydrogenase [unclassified Brevundimonas]|uniref:acyl-CoA dehydrogenase n=1 Tax=unclassified Brevundimonas TaxID=2622653 RepID=UPI000CFBDF77|nr:MULTISPECIES: acyl-CoA dehydrogenase [unclassified Brevundimonas]PRA36029.1 acyl-CoA dehydrogenase [Brevundimonas sp. MYb27]PQZ84520.1 acyl-CoA dehydrogenase [Brevundimonas sp. MYb31]PRB17755.1 acyl-CoA dehydrogenase [Brevundimonas sp. MYb52]PRB38126.1 acyl-CoA dehydrogenase [Brevundimonas sp. MYb46]PRB56092.1 acyl-CoA dehydrogenase [Brevundimonas sp. MYb33]
MASLETSRLLSKRDLDFVLYEWLNVEAILSRPRFADLDRATLDGVLDTAARIAADHFAPHNRKADMSEPTFEDGRVKMIPEVAAALDVFSDAGFFSGAQDYALGGLQLPNVIERAAFAWFQAANIATTAYPFLTLGAANLLKAHGTPDQIDAFVRPMLEGRFFGTMCLSEPQAGSSLGDIRTRAELQDDGSYRLYGTKMWISGGDHDLSETIVHMVLARMDGAPAGVRGISLFVVPKHLLNENGDPDARNDVVLAGLNHKMGYRGTTNTLLNFGEGAYRPGDRAGAVGWLVGEANQGLAAMFHMMNEARIGVGLSAAALGVTGYLHALDYARHRPQGRPASAKAPETPQAPIIAHADVRRMLLAQKAYAEGALALNLYCARLTDDEATGVDPEARADARLLLDMLTPIAKSWPSQWCLEANSLAIQVLGGSGYTRDYPVEQFYRDNRLNPIHEGTHGVQGLDLLGRKVVMQDGAGLRRLQRLIDATAQAAADGEFHLLGRALGRANARLGQAAASAWKARDPDRALANASAYLEAAGHVVIAWTWLEMGLACADKVGDFYEGKRQAARYFFRWELPKVDLLFDLVESGDDAAFAMRDAWF